LGSLTPELIANGLITYVVLLFSLSFHESAHALTALQMGDETAYRLGRISLNPLVHIDLIGTVLLPLLQIFWGGIPLFGWAKPTPVDPRAFREVRKGELLVSGAGPLSNLILALGFTLALFLALRLGVSGGFDNLAIRILVTGVQLNVVLALFNMVPLPPLDGSHVMRWGLPPELGRRYAEIVGPYGSLILLALFATGILGKVLSPFLRAIVYFLLSVAA